MAKAQVVICKDCEKVFAAMMIPYAYEKRSWMTDVRNNVKKGHKIDVMETKDFSFDCKCFN